MKTQKIGSNSELPRTWQGNSFVYFHKIKYHFVYANK